MIDVLEIVVVTIVSFLLGMFWYSPAGFGKSWMKIVKLKKKDAKPSAGLFIVAILVSIIMFGVLNFFMNLFAITNILGGMSLAATLWLGFMVPKDLSPILWENKPFKLFLINGSYGLVMMLMASIIFVVW